MSIRDAIRSLFGRKPQIRLPRRWQRIVMTDSTHFALASGDRTSVKLANLSAGGARVICARALPAHERVTLTVPLGAGSRVNVPAEIVYCERESRGLLYALGVHFMAAGREGIDSIAAFIEEERRRRSGARRDGLS